MALRKFAADYLFTGYTMLNANAVLITDEQGKVQDIIDAAEVHDGLERYNGILCPGFVNCHCHLELSHMQASVPAKTGMTPFLLAVMNNRNRSVEEIADAIIAQDNYMLNKGIVAVGDICNTTDTIPLKLTSALYYQNFIEATGFVSGAARDRFALAEIQPSIYTQSGKSG
jgi:cytosine/adenosine deaminase-related metal-dependent hydrolase